MSSYVTGLGTFKSIQVSLQWSALPSGSWESGSVIDWALPASGNFSNPTNWVGQATPKNTDTAIINNGTTATLTGSASVGNLETGVGYSNANGSAVVNGGNLSATGTVATGVDGRDSRCYQWRHGYRHYD